MLLPRDRRSGSSKRKENADSAARSVAGSDIINLKNEDESFFGCMRKEPAEFGHRFMTSEAGSALEDSDDGPDRAARSMCTCKCFVGWKIFLVE